MKIAASILDCKDRVKGVLELNKTNVSYIHIDVMDGEFVPKVEFDNIAHIRGINLVTKYPMDVHLMMDNPISYINKLENMNIEFITIHLEIDKDKREIFKKIRDLGYKVGLSIKPNTKVSDIEPYLEDIDLVLVMSVEPGLGGQKFIEGTTSRIAELKNLIDKSGRDILIEVDGGINNETITKLDNIDIAVVGSYIVKSDNYNDRVEELLKPIKIVENKGKQKVAKENVAFLSDVEIKKKRILYKILLGIGILPFVCLIIGSIVAGLFAGVRVLSGVRGSIDFRSCVICFLFVVVSGLIAFVMGFISPLCPFLLIGYVLIIISMKKLKELKRLPKE